ncbi:MAG: plasmid pRiA4b ORF-3 family protein [Gammaproteobacteria bacterium]|nr:plasmid pRiA4b ORF-3 family protein [Gammaproteobacteria bacterium]
MHASNGGRAMSIYQIKVTLQNLDLPVWRRIQVKSDTRLDQLHDVLQIVMGWENDHLHGFRAGRNNYGEPDPLGNTVDERKVRLADIAGVGDKLIYEYDFGDSWEHELNIEKVLEPEPSVHYPVCLAGARACPPEDCGGTYGYKNLLEVLRDPTRGEHAEQL